MNARIAIKNCGLQTSDAIDAAIHSGADYLGFILYPPSVRYISAAHAATLCQAVGMRAKTVAVMVNPTDDELAAMFQHWQPDILQLHGDESHERVAYLHEQLSIPIIKAVGIASSEDVAKTLRYTAVSDYLLLDTKDVEYGGTGKAFDWSLLGEFRPRVPWFLSGGLNADNVIEALKITSAMMIDVSSGIESSRGVKDIAKIHAFNQKVRSFS